MNSDRIFQITRQQTERIIRSHVSFGGKRQLAEIVQTPDGVRTYIVLLKLILVVGSVGSYCQRACDTSQLQLLQLLPWQSLDGLFPIFCVHRTRFKFVTSCFLQSSCPQQVLSDSVQQSHFPSFQRSRVCCFLFLHNQYPETE